MHSNNSENCIVYTPCPTVVPALDNTPHHCIQSDKTPTLDITNEHKNTIFVTRDKE